MMIDSHNNIQSRQFQRTTASTAQAGVAATTTTITTTARTTITEAGVKTSHSVFFRMIHLQWNEYSICKSSNYDVRYVKTLINILFSASWQFSLSDRKKKCYYRISQHQHSLLYCTVLYCAHDNWIESHSSLSQQLTVHYDHLFFKFQATYRPTIRIQYPQSPKGWCYWY